MSRIQPAYAFCVEVDREADDGATTLEVVGMVSAYDPGDLRPARELLSARGWRGRGRIGHAACIGQPSRKLSEDDLTGRERQAVERQALLASPGD